MQSASFIRSFIILFIIFTIAAGSAVQASKPSYGYDLSTAETVEPGDIYVDVIQTTAVTSENCTNSGASCSPNADGVDLAQYIVEQVADTGAIDDRVTSTDITFGVLPTLPDGATITNVTLVLNGFMHGDDLGIELIDSGGGAGMIGTTIISHGQPLESCLDAPDTAQCDAMPNEDITAEIPLPVGLIEAWYAGSTPTITLLPQGFANCTPITYFIAAGAESWTGCSFRSPPSHSPQLFIEYAPPVLVENFSEPPSYDPEFHNRTVHEYALGGVPAQYEWVAYAGAARTAAQVSTNDNVPLNIRTDQNSDRPEILTDSVTGHNINYIVVDRTEAQLIENQWLQVHGWANTTAEEYQVERLIGLTLPDPTPEGTVRDYAITNGLGRLYVFDSEPGSTLYISMTAPIDFDINMELFAENPGLGLHADSRYAGRGDGYQMNAAVRELDNDQVQYSLEAETNPDNANTWGLILAHERPECINFPDGEEICTRVTVEVIACPDGTYFTERFGGCQPLVYPHTTIFREGAGPIPATAVREHNGTRIFSEGGFSDNPSTRIYGSDAPNYDYCTTGEERGMPLLGTTADSVPFLPSHSPSQQLTAVRQGSVCVTNSGHIIIIGGVAPGEEYGAYVGPSIRETTARPVSYYNGTASMYHGDMFMAFGDLYDGNGAMVSTNGNDLLPEPQTMEHIKPWNWGGTQGKAWPNMDSNSQIVIDQYAAVGTDTGTIALMTDTISNTTPIPINGHWTLSGSFAQNSFTFEAAAESPWPIPNPGTAPLPVPYPVMASMELRPAAPPLADTRFANNQATIRQLRFTDATIHQTAALGGAHKPIQALILPAYTARLDGEDCQYVSCLDLRNAADINSNQWAMPDITISNDVGSMAFSTAGEMHILSNDHPDSGHLAAAMTGDASAVNDYTAGFDFKTFSGDVTIERGKCNGVQTIIIRGETNLALPSLGDGVGSGPGIFSSFTLCQSKLQQVEMTFDAFPPGIPLGNTGMSLKSLSGRVTVDPEDYARIELQVSFATADGAILTDISGMLVIDTRGQFELGGGARFLATYDVDGSLSVAWSPLDILLSGEIKFTNFLRGEMRAHVWRGQGWGDPAPYPWLPDDNDFHFTGTLAAIFEIDRGQIGQFFGIKIPRRDIVITADISIGEFCKNDACTETIWGVQGKIQVMRFHVGLFVGTRGNTIIGSGLEIDFFFGDKGKRLIDMSGVYDTRQFSAINAIPNGLVSDLAGGSELENENGLQGPCPQNGNTAVCTFTVDDSTGQLLISASWSEGTLPTAVLRTPNGTDVSSLYNGVIQSGEPHLVVLGDTTAEFVMDSEGVLYTVDAPAAGEWSLTLGDLSGGENYNVFYTANSIAPELTLIAPNDEIVDGSLDMTWEVTPADVEAQVHLSYVSEADYAAGVTSGLPIAPLLDADLGSYTWTPVGLASGTYRVIGRIDHPVHGSSYAVSPGTFTYEDTTAPAVPQGLTLYAHRGTDDGLIASWLRNPEADLAAYEVVYSSPSLDDPSGFVERTLTIPPSDPVLAHPEREQTRLNSLLEGIETAVCVRAIDYSGNVSACSPLVMDTPQFTNLNFSVAPTMNSLTVGAGRTLEVTWNPGGVDGYLLSWGNSCAGTYSGPPANEGDSNLQVGLATSQVLSGLPAGTYRVAVRGVVGRLLTIGSFTDPLTIVLTDGIDNDGDGLPDDWAEQFDVSGADEDADGDGLTNGQELTFATNPQLVDSDDDGYSDGDEVNLGGTDPCNPAEKPGYFMQLVYSGSLYVPGDSLRFEIAANETGSDAQTIQFANRSAGELNWTATASEPWIELSATAGGPLRWYEGYQALEVNVDHTGLTPGYYSGEIVIEGAGTYPVSGGREVIPVRLWVLREKTLVGTQVRGRVFLDVNENGVQEPEETIYLEDVAVQAVSGMNVAIATSITNSAGFFSYFALPPTSYTLVASRPGFYMTTPDTLLELADIASVEDDLLIGMARREDEYRVFLPQVIR